MSNEKQKCVDEILGRMESLSSCCGDPYIHNEQWLSSGTIGIDGLINGKQIKLLAELLNIVDE